MRFWVYVATWDAGSRAYGTPVLRTDPPHVCLGAQQAQQAQQVDPRLAVIERVRADWKTWKLPPAVVVAQPEDETLVQVPTRFRSTTPPRATLPPRPVLGMDVTLSITATRYGWDFGDGTRQTVVATDRAPRTEHIYRQPGPHSVRLRTFYTATFTIAGDSTVYPLDGTADVPGRPTRMDAREARTELIDG